MFAQQRSIFYHINDPHEDILSTDLSQLSTFLEFAKSRLVEKRLLAAQRCQNPLQRIENVDEMISYLVELEKFLIGDDDDMRLAVLEQVTNIFLELKKKNQAYFERANRRLSKHIANTLKLSMEVQVNAIDAITNLITSNSATQDAVMTVFVPALFKYIFDASQQSAVGIGSVYNTNITNSVTVLCQIISDPSRYPQEWLFEHFLGDFSALLVDRNPDVRKLSLSAIGAIAKNFGSTFTELCVIPHLERAIQDLSFWVRKVCCDVFVDVAHCVSMQVRQHKLTPLFLLLLNDPDDNIYNAAIRQIGPFIATFADRKHSNNELSENCFTPKSDEKRNLNSIKSFNSTDNLTTLSDFNENFKPKLYDEGIDEICSIDSNDEDFGNDDYNVQFNRIPPGFIIPNVPSTLETLKIDESMKREEHAEIRNNNYSNSAQANLLFRGKNLPTVFERTSKANDSDCDSFSAFWSFGNISPISDADFEEYFSRSSKQKRLRSKLAKSIENYMDRKIISANNAEANSQIENGVLESERHNSDNSKRIRHLVIKTEPIDDYEMENDFTDIKIEVKDEAINEEFDKTKNRTQTQNPAFDSLLSTKTSVQKSSNLTHSKGDVNNTTGNNGNSNYWQRRLDLLHKSVQSVMHNSTSALAVAAQLPSSLKRFSLDSLNSNTNNNSIITEATSTAKISTEQGVKNNVKTNAKLIQTKINEKWLRRQKPAYNAMSRVENENVKEVVPKSSSRLSTTPVTDNRNKNSEERLNLMRESLANNDNTDVEKSSPELSSSNHEQFFTEEELKLLCNSTQDIVPQELLERLNQELTNRPHYEMNWYIAHSIPAIVYTLGRKNWIHIKGLYLSLTDHYHMEVRKSLAYSLHEVAAIIGTTSADRDLLPVFLKFLEDTAEVRYGLLRNLYHFCKMLSFSCRRQLAEKLNCFVTVDSKNSSYRIRAEFAEQLVLLVRLFNAEEVNNFVCAYALTFATDRIAEVRNNGVKILAEVLALFIREEWENFVDKFLDTDGEWVGASGAAVTAADEKSGNEPRIATNSQPITLPLTDSLLHDVRAGFWRTRNWRRRQSFGRMLDIILRRELISEDQFFYIFYDDFMHVSEDEVANVRQYFCSMCKLTRSSGFFKSDRSISISVRSRLKAMVEEDPDMEIRHQAQIALGELDPATAEIDLGDRAALMQAASEAIYARVRQQRQRLSSTISTGVQSETPASVHAQSYYTSYSTNGVITGGTNTICTSTFSSISTGNSTSLREHTQTFTLKSSQFNYFPNQVRFSVVPLKVPPLALAEDEDDKPSAKSNLWDAKLKGTESTTSSSTNELSTNSDSQNLQNDVTENSIANDVNSLMDLLLDSIYDHSNTNL